jgi:NADH dehydrogenase [ubiquinone] 1 alpha subcomplex assembly factor 5
MSESMTVFNRRTVARHRDRAAASLEEHNFLFNETGERLCDRLDDVTRTFPTALDLGCRTGDLGRVIGKRGGIEDLFQCDLSFQMTKRTGSRAAVADEEFLPFATKCFDLILSNLSLHWVNDLPGALMQIRRCLKPGGAFLATMLGGETLSELRQSLAHGEAEVDGGLSPRVSPFADVRDAGNLLQRAGFTLPVADLETITVSYPDPFKLMNDLRGMGESNAVLDARKGFTSRRLFMEAVQYYMQEFADADGRIPATFQIITLTAWVEGENNDRV